MNRNATFAGRAPSAAESTVNGSPHRRGAFTFAFWLAIAFAPAAGAAVPLTTCEQTVEDQDVFLIGDLDCTGSSFVLCDATLDLQGYTLRGDFIQCKSTCTCRLLGPGTIEGWIGASEGFITTDKTQIFVDDVTISNVNPDTNSISNGYGRTTVRNSTITGGYAGVQGERIVIFASSISGATVGVIADRLKVRDSSVIGNARGIDGSRVALKNVIVEGNSGTGLLAGRPVRGGGRLAVRGGRVSANGGDGIIYNSRSVALRDTSISGNGLSGVAWGSSRDCAIDGSGARFGMRGTSATGNGADPACAQPDVLCVDIDTCIRPTFVASTCDVSHVAESGAPGESWGLCSND